MLIHLNKQNPSRGKHPHTQFRHSCGFTLLEILIALLIFTIVSVIMTQALHTVFTSQSRTEERAAALARLQIAMLLISRDIEQTINRPVSNAAGVSEGLIGSTHALTFTHTGFTNPLAAEQRSTLQRVRYQLSDGNLVRLTWPVLDQTTSTIPTQRKLLSGVVDLVFTYLDEQGHFEQNWNAGGQNIASLPRAVRITLTLKNWGTLSQLYLIPGQPLDTPK